MHVVSCSLLYRAVVRGDVSVVSVLLSLGGTAQLLIPELRCTLLAGLLVLLAVDFLAVNAAVLDEAAGRAVLELHRIAGFLAAVGAHVRWNAPGRHFERIGIEAQEGPVPPPRAGPPGRVPT